MLYKKKLSIVLVILLVINLIFFNASVVQAKVYSGKAGKHVTWTYNTKTKTLTFSGKGKMYGSEHWYNESWDDYDDSIWTRKFGEKAKKIVFKKGVTNVGGSAFIDFYELKKVELSSSIKIIEEYAFMGCPKLKTIKFPKKLKIISSNAFSNCNISKLDIPNSVTAIGDEAFSGNRVSYLSLPKKMTTIPEEMFAYNDMTTFTVPKNVKVISKRAFDGCRKLKKIKFNNKLKIIEDNAFFGCPKIQTLELPDSLEKIGNFSFSDCYALENVKLGENVKNIGAWIFCDCYNLKNIEINSKNIKNFSELVYSVLNKELSIQKINVPAGVVTIEKFAFRASSLREVEISETVETLERKLFGSDKESSISKIVIKSSIITKVDKTSFDNLPSDCIIYVPADCVEKYTTLFRSGGLSEKVAILPLEE